MSEPWESGGGGGAPIVQTRHTQYERPQWPYRPHWLADDTEWERQLAAMPDEDVQMLAEQWKLAGGLPPNIIWTTTELPPLWPWLLGCIVGVPALVVLLAFVVAALSR